MAIYSPSQTKSWLTCPVKRSLEQEGWRPRSLGKGQLAGLLGTAFAAGVAIYHQALREGAPPDVSAAQAEASVCLLHEIQKLDAMGCVVRPEDQLTYASLEKRVTKAVGMYIHANPLPDDWSIKHVEHTLEVHGNCRLDLGVVTSLGPAIADVKVKLNVEEGSWKHKKIKDEYGVDWQMRHYLWAYSQYMGQPVSSYFIILVVLEPRFFVEVVPYMVSPEDMLAWEGSALVAWEHMEDGSDWQNLTSCWTPWGPCDFFKACHTYHYEESLMAHEYVKHLRDPLPMPQPMPLPKPFEPVGL